MLKPNVGTGNDESPQLCIRISPDKTSVVITLVGEIDIATLPALQEALDAVSRDGHESVELQLAEVTFMCAHTISVFHRSRAKLAQSGGKLVLRNPSPMTRRVLAICEGDPPLNVC
jgi:anti-anti-sigma factor